MQRKFLQRLGLATGVTMIPLLILALILAIQPLGNPKKIIIRKLLQKVDLTCGQ